MRLLRVVEGMAIAVVVVAFVIFNVQAWIDGRYQKALLPWAALVGLAVGRLIIVYRNVRRERQKATANGTTDPESDSA